MRRIMYRASEDITADELAETYNTTAANIKKLNGVGDIIRKGERVLIDCMQGEYYVVQPFEDIAKIAEKFKVDKNILAEYNGRSVFIGQRIFIPADGKAI